MGSILNFAGKTLLGLFFGIRVVDTSLKSWINKYLKPILSYSPDCFVMTRGWVGFKFWKEEDVVKILNGRCFRVQ